MMHLMTMKEESITQLQENLRLQRMKATAFSCVCLFLMVMALATLVQIPEFVSAQQFGKVLGSLGFSSLVLLCSADSVRTHFFLWRRACLLEEQKQQIQQSLDMQCLVI